MPIESPLPQNGTGNISDLSSLGSPPTTPTTCSRAGSAINDPRSSISTARAAIEAKSFFTWVYEGFCRILALIWNFFSPPPVSPLTSRECSETDLGLLNPSIDFSDEERFSLHGGSENGLDPHSDGSGSNPGSHISGISGVLVNRPSDADSRTSDFSLGSEPTTSGSNPRLTGSDLSHSVSHSETFGYTEAQVEDLINQVDLPSSEALYIPTALTISRENSENIKKVLKTIGYKTALELGYSFLGEMLQGNSSEGIRRLETLGESIDREVHPFRFLLEIFLDNESNAAINALYNRRNDLIDGMMWARFVDNLGKSFLKRTDIDKYKGFFARQLGLTKKHESAISNYLKQRDWNGLLTYLIANVKTPTGAGGR